MKTQCLIALGLTFCVVFATSLRSVARAEDVGLKRACVDASTQGQSERDAGNLLLAKQQFVACSNDGCPAVVRKSCVTWLADVEARLPSLAVRVVDASGSDITDALLAIDGQPSPLNGRPVTLNPGLHTLKVSDIGRARAVERKVLLAERETGRLVTVELLPESEGKALVRMKASEAAPSAPAAVVLDERFRVPSGAIALYGVGVAGLGAFVYFGLSARGELDKLRDRCSPNCDESETEAGRRASRLANVSLSLGAAAWVSAGIWTVVAWRKSKVRRDSHNVQFSPARGGAYWGVGGRF